MDAVRCIIDADTSGPLEADSIEMFSDVVICRNWRLSAYAESLLPPSPLRWSQYVAAGQKRLAE